ARRRNRQNVVPPVGTVVVVVGFRRFHPRVRTTHTGRDGITRHRWLILKNAANTRIGKASIGRTDPEGFHGAGDEAGRKAAKLFQLSGFQGSRHGGSRRQGVLANLQKSIPGSDTDEVSSGGFPV